MGATGWCRLQIGAAGQGADLTFTYKVREDASIGARQAGMTFNVYSFSTEQSWRPLNGLALSVAPFTTTTSVPAIEPVTEGDTATLKPQ
ncbi:hypothetical protein GS923_07660 [Rhodococcus hoagii]|nr:hypothetical protein [Prescottella equi]